MIPFAPDLAIEVISMSESAQRAEDKVSAYLRAGVEEVWQVYPKQQRVIVRRQNSIAEFKDGATLTSNALPGFSVVVSELFP